MGSRKKSAADATAVETELLHWASGKESIQRKDALAREEPLEIRVRGRSVTVTMRTPGHDKELAAGFLLTEGLIRTREDVTEIALCARGEAAQLGNTINVFLAGGVEVDLDRLTRHVFASSSCGLCGKASIDAVHQHFAPIESSVTMTVDTLLALPEKLRQAQATFDRTGGLHAAGIFDSDGQLIVAREDIGRHNAVDKVIGFGFLNRLLPFARHALVVSGRASFEIMQKALAARIPIVASVSAPSSLAVEFARESEQTLAGFVRGTSMNLYSRAERVVTDSIQ